jgi:hypothetical protein
MPSTDREGEHVAQQTGSFFEGNESVRYNEQTQIHGYTGERIEKPANRASGQTERNTYRQTDIQTDRYTDRQTDRQTDRRKRRRTDKQRDI